MKTKTVYICEKCGEEYETEKAVLECEKCHVEVVSMKLVFKKGEKYPSRVDVVYSDGAEDYLS